MSFSLIRKKVLSVMDKFELALKYYNALPKRTLSSSGSIFHYLQKEDMCTLSKFMSVLMSKIAADVYDKQLDYKDFLYMLCKNGVDFKYCSDSSNEPGLLESGEFICLGNPIYDEQSDSFLASYFDLIKSQKWASEVRMISLREYYCDLFDTGCDDLSKIEDYFDSISLDRFICDVGLGEFFDSVDLAETSDNTFWTGFRDSFILDNEEQDGFLILFRSELLPYFSLCKKELLSENDKRYYNIVEDCMSTLRVGSISDANMLILNEPNLKYTYFVWEVSYYYDFFSAGERMGVFSLDPRWILIPYLVDECIRRLDDTLHFIPGEGVTYDTRTCY